MKLSTDNNGASELVAHILEDGEREPEKGQFKRMPLDKWLSARETYRTVVKKRQEAQRKEDELGYHINLATELSRHGLHPVDVSEVIRREGLPPKSKEWFDSHNLNADAWKRAAPGDIVGAVTKDGVPVYFEEPVRDPNYVSRSSWPFSKRKGLPYRARSNDFG